MTNHCRALEKQQSSQKGAFTPQMLASSNQPALLLPSFLCIGILYTREGLSVRELYPARAQMLSGGDSAGVKSNNLLLYYVIYGEMTLRGSQSLTLLPEGFAVFNRDEAHRYTLTANSLAFCLEFYQSALLELTRNPLLYVQCDDQRSNKEDAQALRYQIKRLLHAYTYPNEQNRIRYLRQLYEVLLLLISRFALLQAEDQARDSEENSRNQAIMEYIQTGFTGPINLQELSSKLHLSVSYLSKYIKGFLGMGFVEYVNNLRLYHATHELENTTRSITRIAIDNGFSSLNTFNRVFSAQHGVSPTEHRKRLAQAQGTPNREAHSRQQIQQLIKYFHDHPVQQEQDRVLIQQAQAQVDQHSPIKRIWRHYYSIGNSADLLDSRVKDHLLLLKKELDIQKVSIWSLFAKEMLVDVHASQFNFSRVDSVLDFLVDNGMVPVIDFSMHPKELYSGGEDPIYYQRDDLDIQNMDQYARLLDGFLKHCINRYGVERVESWVFEQGSDIRLPLDGAELSFLSFFRTAYQSVKHLLPNTPVGGGAVFVFDEGQGLEEMLAAWSRFAYKPDFLTVWLSPYDLIEDGQYRKMRFSRDEAYMSKKLQVIKALMVKHGFGHIPLYVSRWNLSLSCRSLINDSCYKGAYMVKTLIDCIDDTEAIVYYGGSDLQYDYFDSFETLIGGYGLLSKDGIKKPSLYALQFMNQLGSHLIQKGDHYAITSDLRDNYYIICHNTGKLNMEYFYRYEHEADYRQVPLEQTLGLEFSLEGVKNGSYKLSRLFINQEIGGLLEEWMRLGSPEVLSREELNYLRGSCVPRQDSQRLEAQAGRLLVRTSLNQNEIQLLKLSFQG